MSNRIVKQRVVVYKSDETPFEITPYVLDWSIENGGVSGGNSGLDGVVQTASITIKNSAEDSYNFNPEVEMGLPIWNIYTFIGDGTNSYAGVPEGYKKGTASFNRIFGIATDWDNTPSTWDTFEPEWTLNDESDYSNFYGEITVSGSNFITPKVMPSGVLFEIACRSVDYSQRNPINTVDNAFVPLLDENVKVEIYTMHEEPSWMSYRWYADGSNNFPNPTDGIPLIGAIGFMKAIDLEVKSWDTTPATWDSWSTSFDEDTGESDYYTTQVVYDQETDMIILGKTPEVNTPIDLSISYYTEEPELEFSGFMGDSIAPNPSDGTITLTCRDKGKLLQDTMIDGYFIYVDETAWSGFEKTDVVLGINTTTNVVTTVLDHNYKVGDPIRFQSAGILPTKNTGNPSPYDIAKMTDVYIIDTIPTTNTFTLKDVDFATTGTGVIYLKLYVMDVDDVIQNILNDTRGVNAPTLYTDFPANYNKRIQVTRDIWDSKSCWDAIQHIASMKALYLSFVFNDTTQDFELILKTIEDKTTADFALTQSGIYSQTQTSSGTDIRNSILLAYYSSKTGTYESVSSIDDDSILAYGVRPSLITEANTSGINTEELAQDLADRILDASKDKIVESVLTLPLLYKDDTHGRINVGDTVSVDYKYLDNQESGDIPFFAIESYRHSFSAGATESSERFMTEFRGNRKKVRTGKRRFKDIESRPGEFVQQKGRDLGERYTIPVVENIEIASTGLESVSLSPRAYAVISWNRPANYFPSHFILEWRKSDDNPDYSSGEQRKIISTTSDIYSERINLDPKTEYRFRITAWSRGNVQGVVSDETVIDEIGDEIAPLKPTNVSVGGLDEGFQVTFNPNTEGDLLGYVVYWKDGSTPTKDTDFRLNDGDYDGKKETTSIKTIISDLVPGTYYVGVTAFDTSGNESSLSDVDSVDSSPKYVIRNQAQFEEWIATLNPEDVGITVQYNEVELYQGTYTHTMESWFFPSRLGEVKTGELNKIYITNGDTTLYEVGDYVRLDGQIKEITAIDDINDVLTVDSSFTSVYAPAIFEYQNTFLGFASNKDIKFTGIGEVILDITLNRTWDGTGYGGSQIFINFTSENVIFDNVDTVYRNNSTTSGTTQNYCYVMQSKIYETGVLGTINIGTDVISVTTGDEADFEVGQIIRLGNYVETIAEIDTTAHTITMRQATDVNRAIPTEIFTTIPGRFEYINSNVILDGDTTDKNTTGLLANSLGNKSLRVYKSYFGNFGATGLQVIGSYSSKKAGADIEIVESNFGSSQDSFSNTMINVSATFDKLSIAKNRIRDASILISDTIIDTNANMTGIEIVDNRFEMMWRALRNKVLINFRNTKAKEDCRVSNNVVSPYGSISEMKDYILCVTTIYNVFYSNASSIDGSDTLIVTDNTGLTAGQVIYFAGRYFTIDALVGTTQIRLFTVMDQTGTYQIYTANATGRSLKNSYIENNVGSSKSAGSEVVKTFIDYTTGTNLVLSNNNSD